MPYLRNIEPRTLKDVLDTIDTTQERWVTETMKIRPNLKQGEREIEIRPAKGGKSVFVPATRQSLDALGNFLDIPNAFLARLGDVNPNLQQTLVTGLLHRENVPTAVIIDDGGIKELLPPDKQRIEPISLVEVAQRVIAPSAKVIECFHTPAEFRLDVVAPSALKRGWGGDKPSGKDKVGDLTAGGLRIAFDLKHNLAPSVQKFMYRLACTNGLSILEPGHKIDARGDTVEEVLAEFERIADLAFREVEHDIAAYYDLRNVPVENPQVELRRIARENRLPDRTLVTLIDYSVGDDEEGRPGLPDNPSMFDVVNLLTNFINDPDHPVKDGVRRQIEQVGGAVVNDHAARCGHCRARLN